MVKQLYFALCLLLFVSAQVMAQTVEVITDGDLVGNTDYTWTADKVYHLDGYVFLEEGGTLTIEPGTVIKGVEVPSGNDASSALIIARGAQIFAEGTANQPIIFTAEGDDVTNPNDLDETDRGLWGGLIILGRAEITDEAAEIEIEGVSTTPNDTRVLYGGTNNNDNSGILRYVSVRHGGDILEDGDEINGITLGAVGDGTIIEFVEVYANDDDGIEWFGGTVAVKYAVVAYCRDDSYDWDTGYRGKGQFWLSIHAADKGGNGGEHDGAKPDANEPASAPVVYNVTYIGSGVNNGGSGQDDDHALLFRDNSGGTYTNSIFTDFTGFALQVEDRAGGAGTPDSYNRLGGDLALKNNIWFGFGEGNELNGGANGILNITSDADDVDATALIAYLGSNDNTLEDPALSGISRTQNGGLDPRPQVGGPAYNNLGDLPADDDFFTEVPYKGAFGATLWTRGWTALDQMGYQPAQQEVVIKDEDLTGSSNVTWTSDNIYLLDGYVFLEAGGKLTIEPGTVIKGQEVPSGNDASSALIIARGAEICANGTAEQPIIFTAEFDDVTDPTDLDETDRGLWGGVILLGHAAITDEAAEVKIEGVSTNPDDERVLYGGNNDEDSSGSMRYVSIRHGGDILEDGDEINGLTLGAVGSGTTLEYIEVFANDDDGIEWFGGTAAVKYAVVAYCRDDSYDWDTGFRGKGQFWFSIHAGDKGGNGGEHDGAKPDANEPASAPVVYNATYIGAGVDNGNSGQDDDHALLFRDNSGGTYANSIFTDFTGYALQVEDRAGAGTADSYNRIGNDLKLENNIWFAFGEGSELNGGSNGILNITSDADDVNATALITYLGGAGNLLEDPMLGGVARLAGAGTLDPRPNADGPAYTGAAAAYPDDSFFTRVAYKGAFCNDGVWIKGWTAVDEYGYLNSDVPGVEEPCDELPKELIVIKDEDLVAGETYSWTSVNEYMLDGYVFLEEGGKLNIEPGTVIRGKEVPSSNDAASALIIARGAQICAPGTFDEPIIFTAENDDLNDATDLDETDRGLWGGVILLGSAAITDEAAEIEIEGISTTPNDPRVLYGGTNNEDNSGLMTYVSIRHGGDILEDGDEINGLTLGGVGSATVLEYIEVFANDDDGIEWFGGTASIKGAVVAFCRDDSFDWDTGYRGLENQFWFSIHAADKGGNGGEHDGAKPDANEPASAPIVLNATYIGSGVANAASGQDDDHALLFRDNSGGNYWNSIFTDFTGFALQVEDRAGGAGTPDSYNRIGNDLTLENNIWFGFGEGSELNGGANGIINVTSDADEQDAATLINYLSGAGNTIEDPMLNSISRTADGSLDPKPSADGPAFPEVAPSIPNESFASTRYKGAFCSEGLWIAGWTALSDMGYLPANATFKAYDNCQLTDVNDILSEKDGIILAQNAPNPAVDFTTFNFVLPQAAYVSLTISDVSGKQIAKVMDNERRFAGENAVTYNVAELSTGLYFYTLQIGEVQLTRSFVVN